MLSRPLFAVHLAIGPTQKLAAVPKGTRLVFPIIGGTFEGPRLRGKVLPGGADWALLRADGVMEIDVRITLETMNGALVYMTFKGIRDRPSGRGEQEERAGDYFRSVATFETGAPDCAFLNHALAVGSGELRDGIPVHTFEEVL